MKGRQLGTQRCVTPIWFAGTWEQPGTGEWAEPAVAAAARAAWVLSRRVDHAGL